MFKWWKKFKRFLNKIKNAIIEFLSDEDDKVVDVKFEEEDEDDKDDDSCIENSQTEEIQESEKKPARKKTWYKVIKKSFKNLNNKAKDAVEKASEDPAEAMKKITKLGIVASAITMFIGKMQSAVIRPIKNRKDERRREVRKYDYKTQKWFTLRRPLTESEEQYINLRMVGDKSISLYSLLNEMGLLKYAS
jgi:hypothetical protein